jgi:nucleotide-binding universal stress UspA family protein
MSYFHTAPVVVGYNGSPTSRAALMVAAGEAVRRNLHLMIVFAEETVSGLVGDREFQDPLLDALHRVSPVIGRDRVTMRDRLGPAARVLCEQAEGAELLVVGRGEVGPLGWFAGSVAIDVLCGAPCPAMIVGDPGPHIPHTGPVIAGVDQEHADAVLDAAFREADLRSSELIVVHAWNHVHWLGPDGIESFTVDDEVMRSHHVQWLRDIVEPFQRKYPRVQVTEAPREGRAASVLLESSAAAGLIVVGSRGRGPVSGLVLGSVGQRLVRHALCPVLVVH